MPSEGPPHFWIPPERIRSFAFEPQGFTPQYPRADLATHGRRLKAAFTAVKGALAERADRNMASQVFLQVSTPEGWPVRAQAARLAQSGLEYVATLSTDASKAIAMIEGRRFEQLGARLERYAGDPTHPGKSYLAILENLEEVPPEAKVDPGILDRDITERVDCVVALYAGLPTAEKVAIAEVLGRRLATTASEPSKVLAFGNGVVLLTAGLTAEEALAVSTEFVTVRSITEDERIVTTRAVRQGAVPNQVTIDPPQVDAPVAIVDSGINDRSGLLSGLVSRRFEYLPLGAATCDFGHGTFVASRVVFGDGLESQLSNGHLLPICRAIDVAVIGKSAQGVLVEPTESDIAAALHDVVPRVAGECRVVNLSIGPPKRVRDGEVSELAKVIDYLSHKHDVLFVIAAGNIQRAIAPHPGQFALEKARVLTPAEALLGLAVGSYAKYSDTTALASSREVSPFSRRGPGADGGVKPDLVAHGGNMNQAWQPNPRIAVYGLLGDGQDYGADVGTSFAAPLVAQDAVRLFHALPTPTANLVRALLVHAVDEVVTPSATSVQPAHLRGFGEPAVHRVLTPQDHAALFLYEGRIRKNVVQQIPFLVPSSLAGRRGRTCLRLRVTVVYDPLTNPDNELEYSNCRIVTKLLKRQQVGFREVQVGQGASDSLNPWNPVTYFDKGFGSSFLPGEWEVRLRLMTRGKVPGDYEQRFAIVIEVIDPLGRKDVAADVAQEGGTTFTPGTQVAA